VIEMNKSGALKISALFVVAVLCLSTVGFGLLLSTNPSNNTKSTTAVGAGQPSTSTDNNASNGTDANKVENGDGLSIKCTQTSASS
jgi:hypothetical protein